MSKHIIVWFRQDLRLNDNPALESALSGDATIIPVFIDDEDCGRQAGAMGQWWRDTSLARLHEALVARGSKLIYRRGKTEDVLPALIEEVGASGVYWNRQYEADIVTRDTALKARLKNRGLDAESFNGSLLFEP